MNYNIVRQNTEKNHVLDASKVAVNALWIALVFLSTRFLQFPIPLGYAHLGNAMILLAAVYFGPVTGMLSGGLGSALADLTSFPGWTLPTLIIKLLMGLICGIIAGGGCHYCRNGLRLLCCRIYPVFIRRHRPFAGTGACRRGDRRNYPVLFAGQYF